MKASSVRHTQRILKINNENPGYDFSKIILFYSNLFSIFYSLFSVSGLLVHLRLDLLYRKERKRERRAGGTLRDMKEWEREWDRQRYRGKGRDKEVEKDRKRKKTRQSLRRKEEKNTGQNQ